jgi:hypothetical protein
VPAPAASDPAPTRTPRRTVDRDAAGKVLRSALRERDQRIGLGLPAANTVASVLRVAVTPHTPPVSRATFRAHIDAQGRVVGLQVLSFSAGTAAMWNRASQHARRLLASRTFAMRGDFAAGALVTVHVQSEVQWPSGKGRRKPVTKPKIEPPRWLFTPQDPPEGRSFRTPPWGPPPTGGLEAGVVGRFDASDIDAVPQRIVYTTVDAQPL